MSAFIPGQRWISESEPELGLGTVVRIGNGRVQVEFKAAGETRTYAVEQAPLKRVASASLRLGKQVAELRERYDFVRWVTSGA